MRAFSVSFEIVTPESAEAGDAAERGMVDDGLTLYQFGHGEARGYGLHVGADESRSLHIPPTVTAASSQRIARLARAQGATP